MGTKWINDGMGRAMYIDTLVRTLEYTSAETTRKIHSPSDADLLEAQKLLRLRQALMFR